jgi:chromosome segregation ATPase
MPRKKIADLIRNEAQKPADSELELAENIQSEPIEAAEETLGSELEATVTELQTALQEARAKDGALDRTLAEVQSELEQHRSLIQNLEGQLNQSQQRNEEFGRLNADLQQQLQDQKTQVKKLESELAAATKIADQEKNAQTKLTTELEKQKQINQKLTKEVEQLSQVRAELEETKKSAIQLAAANEKALQELTQLQQKQPSSNPKNLPMRISRPTTADQNTFPPFSTTDLTWMD